jgi:hypothetical protein
LIGIARAAGIEHPTPEMQRLMEERNQIIMQRLGPWAGSVERYRVFQQANSEYLTQIENAALKGRSGKESSTALRGSSNDNGADGGAHNSHFLLMIVIALAVLVFLLAAVVPIALSRSTTTKVITIDISVASQEPVGVGSPAKQRVSALVMGQPVAAHVTTCATERIVVGSPAGGKTVSGATDSIAVGTSDDCRLTVPEPSLRVAAVADSIDDPQRTVDDADVSA